MSLSSLLPPSPSLSYRSAVPVCSVVTVAHAAPHIDAAIVAVVLDVVVVVDQDATMSNRERYNSLLLFCIHKILIINVGHLDSWSLFFSLYLSSPVRLLTVHFGRVTRCLCTYLSIVFVKSS